MTAAEIAEVQFGKWHRSHPLPNCAILTKAEVAELLRREQDDPVVTITASDGKKVFLTRSALVADETKIPFSEIERHVWISHDRDEAARDKREHFDRLHIVTRSGDVTLDRLGQAVFPLMKTLDWIQRERKKQANPEGCVTRQPSHDPC